MLGMLKNPPEPFGDVIRTHFKLKASSIVEQLDKWLQIDDGKVTQGDGFGVPNQPAEANNNNTQSSSSSALQRDVEELKELLQRLQGEGSGVSIANGIH